MRIIIDLQGAQASNAKRGIGRYSIALAKAILQHAGHHEILLALNGQFPTEIANIRQQFASLIPQENIYVWQTPEAVESVIKENDWRRNAAECMRETFLASLNPDIVHISSLFESLGDNAVTSIGIQEPNLSTSMTLYDLIPLIYRESYLKNPNFERWYEEKLNSLKRSQLYLAISESSRMEGIQYLGLPDEAIVNISTAADAQFKPINISPEAEHLFRHQYGVLKPFILHAAGMDPRKNIHGLIRAFAQLPLSLRQKYQLVIVCHVPEDKKIDLHTFITSQGLTHREVILTGHIPENDLIKFYNLCDLFAFPSLHEGFGLPALEAMSCGAAVISSNTSSIPEVIGNKDALFNPHSDESIAHKIQQVLTDDSFHQSLKQHGLEQSKKFSWDVTAKRAIAAFEMLHEKNQHAQKNTLKKWVSNKRHKLAYFSPLPSLQSGIADYSATLLPELNRYYDIDVFINQHDVSDPWIKANCNVQPISFFEENSYRYDRVLYHFGNSVFHHHLFSLIENHPGVVVLHDFFLSGIVAHMDVHHMEPNFWAQTLYSSHGYHATQARFHTSDTADVVYEYPCNLDVLDAATGVIVHSDYSRTLANHWYGASSTEHWSKIPLLRKPPVIIDNQTHIKQKLGFSADDFIICSFGFMGPTKLNHRLLNAWLSSELSQHKNCHLVFVGENNSGEYGINISDSIKGQPNVKITGFVSLENFFDYLSIADMAVQLRLNSRGETSAAVLDCLNYGIPTIINSNGSLAEIPSNCVYMLPDIFEDEELITALEVLWKNKAQQQSLKENSQAHIATHHSPHSIGEQYYEAIETYYAGNASSKSRLLTSLSTNPAIPDTKENWLDFSNMIGFNQSVTSIKQKQIFIDISKLVQHDGKTGIQRATKGILKELLLNPPKGYRIEPIYASAEHTYRYARKYSLKFLDCPDHLLEDRLIEPKPGDIFFGLDLEPYLIPGHHDYFQTLRMQGVKVYFVIYDLIPLLRSEYFLSQTKRIFQDWFKTVSCGDGLICISRSVAKDANDWSETHFSDRKHTLNIAWFHLGANLEKTNISTGVPKDFEKDLQIISSATTILMVGTVEPRKAYAQTLSAFELLWKDNQPVNLVIVGKEGWMVDDLTKRLNHHAEKGKRLFWYSEGSDELLLKLYASASGVFIASHAEGFGLPIIEAAQHKKPLLVRDIPVFKEIASEHATYFPDTDSPEALAHSLETWLNALNLGEALKSDDMPYLNWSESAQQVVSLLLNKDDPRWVYQHNLQPLEIS